MSVQLGPNGLIVNDKDVPIYSGTVHYWRLEPELWEPILQRTRDLGFEMIETYIPWGVHEIAPGVFDFGEHDPHKDLPHFLDLCHQLGISVCVRPGPHINAELTWFGFPERILADPTVWAYTATGAPAIIDRLPQPFAIPSYASETLFAETAKYFDALCPILIPHLAPTGAVVACQVDNETCYFFRTRLYDMDYSADSLRLYRGMLAKRYGSIESLNSAYGTHYRNFEAAEAPRDFDAKTQRDVPRLLDWAAYKEYQLTTALERIGTLLRERGIRVPLYHDVAYQTTTPIDVNTLQAQPHLDFVGTNLYANQEEYASTITHRVRYQAGTQKLPFVPEYGAGLWWFHDRTYSPAEQEFFVLAGIMHGLRALNFYMLVERDRWQGSPITRDNRLRPGYADFFRKLSDFVRQTHVLQSDKYSRVLVLQNYELNRFAAAFTTLNNAYLSLIGVPPSLSQIKATLGYQVDPGVVGNLQHPDSWICGVEQALQTAQVEYDLSDTHAPAETLARYPLIFVPTADFFDVDEQQRLLDYACNGGHLVFGPVQPTLDRLMNPASVLGTAVHGAGTFNMAQGKITFLPTLLNLDLALLEMFANPVKLSNPALRLTIRDGQTRLCFIANPTAHTQQTTLTLNQHQRLRGLWNAVDCRPGDSITVAPYTIQIWEIK